MPGSSRVYQAELDNALEIVGYKRLGLKNRGELGEISVSTNDE